MARGKLIAVFVVLVAAAPAAADVALAPLPGDAVALVWSDAGAVRAQRVDAAARTVGEVSTVLPCAPTEGRIAAVPTPTGVAVVLGARGGIWLRRLGPDVQPTTDVTRIWKTLPRPVTAASVGGQIGMLAREDAGPVVGTPQQGAIGVLVGMSISEGPQILLTRYEGLPVIGPGLPWHAGYGEAVLAARSEELATMAASDDGAFLTRIGLDGREIGSPVKLTSEGATASSPALAGRGQSYVASWEEGGSTRVAVLTVRRGEVEVTQVADDADRARLRLTAVAAGPAGFALVGVLGTDLVVHRLDLRGRPRGRPTVVTNVVAPGEQKRPAAVYVGQTLLIAVPGQPPRAIAIQAGGRVLGAR